MKQIVHTCPRCGKGYTSFTASYQCGTPGWEREACLRRQRDRLLSLLKETLDWERSQLTIDDDHRPWPQTLRDEVNKAIKHIKPRKET